MGLSYTTKHKLHAVCEAAECCHPEGRRKYLTRLHDKQEDCWEVVRNAGWTVSPNGRVFCPWCSELRAKGQVAAEQLRDSARVMAEAVSTKFNTYFVPGQMRTQTMELLTTGIAEQIRDAVKVERARCVTIVNAGFVTERLGGKAVVKLVERIKSDEPAKPKGGG